MSARLISFLGHIVKRQNLDALILDPLKEFLEKTPAADGEHWIGENGSNSIGRCHAFKNRGRTFFEQLRRKYADKKEGVTNEVLFKGTAYTFSVTPLSVRAQN